MNKKGFTLAEVVVTLGVVGIVAAITTPSLMNLIPDKNKVQVLKAYKLINDANVEFLQDTGLYTTDGTCVGLDCTDVPSRPLSGISDQANIKGGLKYGRLLCLKMHTDGCSVGSTQITFTTPDGIDWSVDRSRNITIDIHATSGQSTYKFNVNEYGKISGVDKLTQQYLITRDKLNNKANDYKAAGLKK